jgi:MYXO-CTERM domain-containing protein
MIGAEQCGKAGTCSTAKCTRVGPISGGASGDGDNDGGVRIGTITYDCYRCIASDPTSPQPTGGFGSNCEPLSSGSGSDHGGCSAVTTDVDSSLAAVIGAGVLLLLRRRKVR